MPRASIACPDACASAKNRTAAAIVGPGPVTSIRCVATMSSGARPMTQTNFVPPASTPPYMRPVCGLARTPAPVHPLERGDPLGLVRRIGVHRQEVRDAPLADHDPLDRDGDPPVQALEGEDPAAVAAREADGLVAGDPRLVVRLRLP